MTLGTAVDVGGAAETALQVLQGSGRAGVYVAAAVVGALGYLVARMVLRLICAVLAGVLRAVTALVVNAVTLLVASRLIQRFPTTPVPAVARASVLFGLLSALRHAVTAHGRRPSTPTQRSR
jgi:hypothetical protein